MTPIFILGMITAAIVVSLSISLIKKESYNDVIERLIFTIAFNLIVGYFIFGIDI